MKTMKRLVAALVVLALLMIPAAYLGLRRAGGIDGISQSTVKSLVAQQRDDLFNDGKLHVFTLGTGSPQLGTGRMPPANAVIAGDEFIVIDAGEGASRTMGNLYLPIQHISAVFITHWHSDHFAGLGQVLNQSWNADRHHDIEIYGPDGVVDVVAGIRQQYAADLRYRSVGHVEHNDPAFAFGTPVEVDVPAERPMATVFERNGVVVKAFPVDHGHVKPAFGYRVEYNGKIVVFSGDTVATPLILEAAENADLLIHEAINTRMVMNAVTALEEVGLPVEADRARAIIGYHADTIELAKIAEQANVRKLVLTHLIPVPPNGPARWLFARGMNRHYDGVVILARDGQEFAL